MYYDMLLYNFLLLIGSSCAGNKTLLRRIRITGGVPVPIVPSHLSTSVVSLRSRTAQAYFGDNHFCTGCLLSDFFVLTSAKCVTSKSKVIRRPRELVVVAGIRNRLNQTVNCAQMPVSFAAVHINYTMFNLNDIALLKLAIPTDENVNTIDPAPPELKPPPYGSKCHVMGWGRAFAYGPLANTLGMIEVELISNNRCREYIPEITDDMLCTLSSENTLPSGPCPGDTGGPLFCNNSLIGIVSYTTGCTRVNFPTVYTNVYYHYNWIEDLIDRGGQEQLKLAIGVMVWLYIVTW